MTNAISFLMIGAGGLLLYAGVKDKSPIDVVKQAVGNNTGEDSGDADK